MGIYRVKGKELPKMPNTEIIRSVRIDGEYNVYITMKKKKVMK